MRVAAQETSAEDTLILVTADHSNQNELYHVMRTALGFKGP